MKVGYPKIGDTVRFSMPIEGVQIGVLEQIDGENCYIRALIGSQDIHLHRYRNEVRKA